MWITSYTRHIGETQTPELQYSTTVSELFTKRSYSNRQASRSGVRNSKQRGSTSPIVEREKETASTKIASQTMNNRKVHSHSMQFETNIILNLMTQFTATKNPNDFYWKKFSIETRKIVRWIEQHVCMAVSSVNQTNKIWIRNDGRLHHGKSIHW